MTDSKLEVWMESDGTYYELQVSFGDVCLFVYDRTEAEILQFIADIQNIFKVLKDGGGESLKDRKEGQIQECLVE